jgi:hypothetical protein
MNDTPNYDESRAMTEQMLALMPDGVDQPTAMLAKFTATLPDGTPPVAVNLLRRAFLAGAMSHLEQVRAAFELPELADGNPEPLMAAVAGLGMGVLLLMMEETEALEAARRKTDAAPRVILMDEVYTNEPIQ